VITPEQAFDIAHLGTIVYMLNERANSTWLEYKPAKLEVVIQDEFDDAGLNVIGHSVFAQVGNISRTIKRRLTDVLTHDEAVFVMKGVLDFIEDHPI